MSEKKLLADLERLRSELDTAIGEDAAARERLHRLLDEISTAVVEPEQTVDRDMMREVKGVIESFAADHPRAMAIFNDITVTLSNMGI